MIFKALRLAVHILPCDSLQAAAIFVMYISYIVFVIIINFLVETGTRKIILTFVLMFHIRTMYYFTFIISKKGEGGREEGQI